MPYENALIVANGDYVMLHGRFTNIGQPANWIAADIDRRRPARRTLGCHPGRSHPGRVQERAADVQSGIPF
jgi:hypothetical protein